MDIGNDRVFNLLLKFSIPAITGMLVNALYNMVDRIFISYGVGATAFSSLSVTGPISNLLLAFSMLVGIGAATNISIRMGEGDMEAAERTLGNAVFMLLLTSFGVMIFGEIFLARILYMFGASEVTIPYAVSYMRIILFGFPFLTCGFGCYHMTRASGNPTRAMFSMLLGAGLNIVLDALFIFVFGWGIEGAAYATIISQAVSMFWILTFFVGKKSKIRIKIHNFKPDAQILLKIYAIGISPFLTQIALSSTGAIVNNLLLFYGGDDAIGANGAVQMVIMLFLMPIFGLNQGAQPVIGFNYGAKKYKRVRKALKYANMMAFIIGFAGMAFAQIMAGTVINFFTNGHEGINQYAIPALKSMTLLMPIGAVQILSAVYFQAIGEAKTTLFLSMLRQVLLVIPLAYILATMFGINGIWFAWPVADVVSFIITMTVLYFGFKKMKAAEALIEAPA